MATGVVEQNKAERAAGITENGPIADFGNISDEKFFVDGDVVTQTGESGTIGRFARVYLKGDDGWQMIALYTENAMNYPQPESVYSCQAASLGSFIALASRVGIVSDESPSHLKVRTVASALPR